MSSNLVAIGNGTELIRKGQVDDLAALMVRSLPAYAQMIKDGIPDTVADLAMVRAGTMAVALGANPFAGDIHVWASRRGEQWEITVTPATRFLIGYAQKMDGLLMGSGGSDYRHMNDEEREQHGLEPGDIGIITEGARLSQVKQIVALGAQFLDAKSAATRIGVGIVRRDEMEHQRTIVMRKNGYGKWYVDGRAKTGDKGTWTKCKKGDRLPSAKGRTWAWRARNRSVRDLITQLGLYPSANELDTIIEKKQQEAQTADVSAMSVDEINADLFG